VIGGVGLIQKLKKPIDHKFKKDKSIIIVVGKTFGHLEQSAFYEEVYALTEGQPPEINLINEKNNGQCILEIIKNDLTYSVHDVSSGGILVALTEMSIDTNYGVLINKPRKLTNLFKYFFGEDQSRYIIEIDRENLEKVEKILKNNNIFYENIGTTQKNYFEIIGEMRLGIKDLYKINNQWYNNY
jgi:phosphoribosylformylglycinamidine synthase